MKIVVLAEDDIIDGKLYVAGERVRVPDDYANVRRVVGDVAQIEAREKEKFERVRAEKEEREKQKEEKPPKDDKPPKEVKNGR